MARYDLERLLDDVLSVLQANLNTQIAAINTEKADSLTLKTVPNEAYFLQQLNGKMASYDPIVLYGVDDISSVASGPNVNHTFSLSAIIVVVDSGQDVEIGKRMFRYGRALEDTFKRNWSGGGRPNIEVKSLVPVPLTAFNTGESYRAVGVALKANVGG